MLQMLTIISDYLNTNGFMAEARCNIIAVSNNDALDLRGCHDQLWAEWKSQIAWIWITNQTEFDYDASEEDCTKLTIRPAFFIEHQIADDESIMANDDITIDLNDPACFVELLTILNNFKLLRKSVTK